MACVLQIGAGGVGGVVAHKMAMNRESFTRIILASRTLSKCQAIADSIREKGLGEIEIDSIDADSVESVVALIEKYRPKLVVNVALPYQDLSIMEACLRTKTHYLDTANYEHPDSAHFEYKEQWAYDTRYKQAGIFALLGSGFDPGVTNVFCAYAQKHYFDEIHSIDILDCNAGDHGYAFATNFNPEINLREVSSKARYWVKGDSSLTQSLNECGNETAVTTDKVAPLSHFAQHSNLTQDTRIADSKKVGSNTESNSLVSQADLALNPDLKQDTIYRKFEREEQHWRVEVEAKQAQREQQKRGNSKIFDENANIEAEVFEMRNRGFQGGGEGSYLSGNDRASNAESAIYRSKTTRYAGGQWRDIAPLALMKEWDYPEVGVKNSYLLYHEELESLIRNIKGLRKIRFFMTFGESYLTHMKVLENIGFLRIDEVAHKGGKIVPIEVLKTLLPDPASLASRTKGQTHIGCYIKGVKDGKERTIYIYNICDHEACYKEVNAQGVSYTTGVPAMIGAKLICEDKWGLNAPKGHSVLSDKSGSASPCSLQRTLSASHSQDLHNPDFSSQSLECQDSKKDSKLDSQKVDSTPYHSSEASSIQSYNAERLKLNSDMPKGGEYQGIDSSSGSGVWNMEQNDPDPFMSELNKQGLPYVVCEIESNGSLKVLEDGRKHHG
ncbi:saccharopine dehydrogenase family protein [Helicobacter sp.]|uniref:saccharopine dehydrogenase family protein n=1 Tax=Helicobacter sp. TaxID=218 RepID=UPI00388F5919